jgi:hypothetical protein
MHLLKSLSFFFTLMGSTTNYVKYPFPSIFFKKTYFSLVAEFPNYWPCWQNQTFSHLSINYPQIIIKTTEKLFQELSNITQAKIKKLHTSRLPIQISRRFDSITSASGGSIYVSNTPINSMKKNQLQLLVSQTTM